MLELVLEAPEVPGHPRVLAARPHLRRVAHAVGGDVAGHAVHALAGLLLVLLGLPVALLAALLGLAAVGRRRHGPRPLHHVGRVPGGVRVARRRVDVEVVRVGGHGGGPPDDARGHGSVVHHGPAVDLAKVALAAVELLLAADARAPLVVRRRRARPGADVAGPVAAGAASAVAVDRPPSVHGPRGPRRRRRPRRAAR